MGTSVDEGSGTESQVEEPGLSGTSGSDWTSEEQINLDQAILLYPADQYPTAFERTILVAALVPTRSAREVALRINWLSSKSSQKSHELKRRGSLPTSTLTRVSSLQAPSPNKSSNSKVFSRTSASKHGSVGQQPQSNSVPPTSASDQQNFPPQLMLPPPLSSPLLPSLSVSCLFQSSSPPTNSNSSDDACVNIGVTSASAALSATDSISAKSSAPSPSGSVQPPVASVQSLIDQNYVILTNFKKNMQQCRVVENTELLVRLRDNIVTCINQMGNLPSTTSTLPPLPVQLNLELAGKFLPNKMVLPPMPSGMPPFSFNPALGPPPMMLPPGMPMPSPGMIPMPMLSGQPGLMPPFPIGIPPPLMSMQLPTSTESTPPGFVPVPPSRHLPGPALLSQSVPLSAMGTPGNVTNAMSSAGMVPMSAVLAPLVRQVDSQGRQGEP
ncbi:hypothetical protein CEUSTIGMA_g3553.t1 [Chlamydomonas eustigma]|uniref:Myb-like domain-containing protein n=1 Tax=Chlamydomonas eustigma TaxID=1157962 RepID=A0A250X030_9CHLO|nr:hypothetical protein CEUSTIGMA_g3553.t1 [Chlamydomonas eustigma]|eukprot:GAX76110.1 hypothetical protein CEUSTIGMA_g3553.t1 [Chlamydomonas eustigma]